MSMRHERVRSCRGDSRSCDRTERAGSTRERQKERCGFVLGVPQGKSLGLFVGSVHGSGIRLDPGTLSFDEVHEQRAELFPGQAHYRRTAGIWAAWCLDAANASSLRWRWNGCVPATSAASSSSSSSPYISSEIRAPSRSVRCRACWIALSGMSRTSDAGAGDGVRSFSASAGALPLHGTLPRPPSHCHPRGSRSSEADQRLPRSRATEERPKLVRRARLDRSEGRASSASSSGNGSYRPDPMGLVGCRTLRVDQDARHAGPRREVSGAIRIRKEVSNPVLHPTIPGAAQGVLRPPCLLSGLAAEYHVRRQSGAAPSSVERSPAEARPATPDAR